MFHPLDIEFGRLLLSIQEETTNKLYLQFYHDQVARRSAIYIEKWCLYLCNIACEHESYKRNRNDYAGALLELIIDPYTNADVTNYPPFNKLPSLGRESSINPLPWLNKIPQSKLFKTNNHMQKIRNKHTKALELLLLHKGFVQDEYKNDLRKRNKYKGSKRRQKKWIEIFESFFLQCIPNKYKNKSIAMKKQLCFNMKHKLLDDDNEKNTSADDFNESTHVTNEELQVLMKPFSTYQLIDYIDHTDLIKPDHHRMKEVDDSKDVFLMLKTQIQQNRS
jgi:hypothetical protein